MSNQMVCVIHNVPLVWEEGGIDKPTVFGRHRCDACDAMLAKVMEEMEGPCE